MNDTTEDGLMMSTNQGVGAGDNTTNKDPIESGEAKDDSDVEFIQPAITQSKSSFTLECDDILQRVGGFSYWQWMNVALLCIPSIVSGFILLTYSFTGIIKQLC